MKRVVWIVGVIVLFGLVILLAANWNSLDDGVAYLQNMATYAPVPPQPLDAQGKFGFCHEFVRLRNAQRAQFIVNYLDARGISYQRLPIYDSGFDNFLVPFGPQENGAPATIFSAHYDKVYDDPDYHGASDNSAAVCMLLVAANELHTQSPERPVAILLTGQEEVGLVGAQAFYDYATQNNLQIADILNFDNIGRGGLAVRASGERSGFVFTVPLLGELVYDGRQAAPASGYRQPDSNVLARMRQVAPVALYDRMVAKSDGTFWQDRGWDAVNLSSDNIFYLEQTWHSYADRVELLEQQNFERALELVLGYAREDAK